MKILRMIILICGAFISLNALTLDEAIKQTLNNDPSILSMVHQKNAKSLDIDLAKSQLYPKIEVSLTNTNRDYILNGTDIERTERYNAAGVNINQPIYNQEIYEKIFLAHIEQTAQEYKVDAKVNDVVAKLVEIYTKALTVKSQVAYAQSTLEYRQSIYEHSKALYENRMQPLIEYQTAHLNYQQAKSDLHRYKNELLIYYRMLSQYTGKNVTNITDIQNLKLELPSQTLTMENNPKLQAAKTNISVAKQRIDEAKAAHYPSLHLFASYSEYDSKTPYNDYEEEGMVKLELKIPLFQGWYVTSNTAKQKELYSAASYDYEQEKNSISNRYKEISLQLELTQEILLERQKSMQIVQELYKSSKTAYENNKISVVQYKKIKNQVAEIRHELNTVKFQKINLMYQLYLLTRAVKDDYIFE